MINERDETGNGLLNNYFHHQHVCKTVMISEFLGGTIWGKRGGDEVLEGMIYKHQS